MEVFFRNKVKGKFFFSRTNWIDLANAEKKKYKVGINQIMVADWKNHILVLI